MTAGVESSCDERALRIRSTGTSSHAVSRAMLSASGFPVPFSIRESVEAETEVLSATSRRLRPSSSRRRFTARPSSSVFTSALAGRLVRFMLPRTYHGAVLEARLFFTSETATDLTDEHGPAGLLKDS